MRGCPPLERGAPKHAEARGKAFPHKKKHVNPPLRKGFSLVEILIVAAIIAILSTGAYIGIQRVMTPVNNNKVEADLQAIANVLENYKTANDTYPIPSTDADKNLSCFYLDTSYAHDCTTADFIQTQIDHTLITARNLKSVPTDPRTNARYAYGVTTDGQFFQVAGNYQTDEGAWIAKVRGNVERGYILPSLLRAFDGPNFVMDGEGYLPYSPDHMSITARLDDISNQVTVDGQTIAPDSPDEDKVVKPGSTIEVGPGETVAIYFSDGSVTFLDGDEFGASLGISPRTEILQNDKDGIITKIRLKLFSGKIWSKVARLAAESEFNVETTAAIAGVRGTEFGINAEGNELIVLSGTVVAREMTTAEYDEALSMNYEEWEEPFVFDSNDEAVFPQNKVANGTGSFEDSLFTIPGPEGTSSMLPGTDLNLTDQAYQEYIEDTFYKSPFNNNYKPKILEVDTATATKEKIVFEYLKGVNEIIVYEDEKYKTEWTIVTAMINLAETEITIDLSSETNMLSSNGSFEFMFSDENKNETGFSYPAIPLHTGTELSMEDIHNMGGQEVNVSVCIGDPTSISVTGPTVVVVGSNSKYEATGTYANNCTKDITSQCNWNTNWGSMFNWTFSPTAVGNAIISCNIINVTGITVPSVKIISALNGECWGPDLFVHTTDDKGFWDDPNDACWIIAAEANTVQDCDTACDYQISATCVDKNDTGEVNWDDDNENICITLASMTNPPFSSLDMGGLVYPFPPAQSPSESLFDYAPHLYYDPGTITRCYSRVAAPDPADLCGKEPSDTKEHRICRCM